MTGYEILEIELSRKFNPSKVAANRNFIMAIIEILTTNPEEKIALQLAEKLKDEATEKERVADNKLEQVRIIESRYNRTLQVAESKLKEADELWEQIKQLKQTIDSCETAEARDKVRLMALFKADTDVKSADHNTVTRGISNILGNGGAKRNDDNRTN